MFLKLITQTIKTILTDSLPKRDNLHVSTKNMAMVHNSETLSAKFKVPEIASRLTGHLDGKK